MNHNDNQTFSSTQIAPPVSNGEILFETHYAHGLGLLASACQMRPATSELNPRQRILFARRGAGGRCLHVGDARTHAGNKKHTRGSAPTRRAVRGIAQVPLLRSLWHRRREPTALFLLYSKRYCLGAAPTRNTSAPLFIKTFPFGLHDID